MASLLFPFRSFSWDQRAVCGDCINLSQTWPWSTTRSVTVCAEGTQEDNRVRRCSLSQSSAAPWLICSRTCALSPNHNLSCLLQGPFIFRIYGVFQKRRHQTKLEVVQQFCWEEAQKTGEKVFGRRNKMKCCPSLASYKVAMSLLS